MRLCLGPCYKYCVCVEFQASTKWSSHWRFRVSSILLASSCSSLPYTFTRLSLHAWSPLLLAVLYVCVLLALYRLSNNRDHVCFSLCWIPCWRPLSEISPSALRSPVFLLAFFSWADSSLVEPDGYQWLQAHLLPTWQHQWKECPSYIRAIKRPGLISLAELGMIPQQQLFWGTGSC